ncbi:hypothetical protein D9756_000095 [Leucocoprinus leucothites]|uniref:F-box domain-containing protein n=1 Tax=Leucocoprinus leucothites TaxID=201217 RepID=A0A8H5GEN0_9AGAR|nr:hypothetical protein D9756_000095 [Leucoagaricus leucothites]
MPHDPNDSISISNRIIIQTICNLTVTLHMSETISSLPSEILSKIFLELDCSNLLSTRLTCKGFYDVTKSRHFWLEHIQKIKETFGYILPLEASCYTTQELDFDIDNIAWNDIKLGKRSYLDFLPGSSRWLLVRQSEAVAFILDVESPPSAPDIKVLFDCRGALAPDREHPRWDPKNVFSYWIDRSKSRLSFLLVATSFYFYTSRVVITEVELSGDGPSNTTFMTRPRTTFRTSLPADLPFWMAKLNNTSSWGSMDDWRVAANDRYYVEYKIRLSAMRVHDYRTLVGNDDDPLLVQNSDPVLIRDCKFMGDIRFIHGNILVALGTTDGKIYIFEIHPESDISPTVPKVEQLHIVDMDGLTYMFSPIKWFPDASKIIFFNGETSLPWAHLRIPHDKSTPSKTT